MGRPVGRPLLYGARLRVNVTPETLAAVNREALTRGITVNDVVREAVADHLRRQERKQRRAARS